MRCEAASSTAEPNTASRLTGPVSAVGTSSNPSPADPDSADPPKTNGSSGHASCHEGTDVSARSTAVYVASPGATSADATPAGRLSACTRPRSGAGTKPGASAAAARPAGRLNAVRIHVPTLIGEVGLATRSM